MVAEWIFFSYFVVAKRVRVPCDSATDQEAQIQLPLTFYKIINQKKQIAMGKNIKNYVGAILALLGAVLMILATFVPAMGDLCDQNWYTVGSFVLIIGGIFAHVFINKYFSEEAKGKTE